MNNKEKLELNKWLYSQLLKQAEETDYAFQDRYPKFLELIECLISDLESYVKREEELVNVENHISKEEYRDYQYTISLDAKRDCLYGEIKGLNGWYYSDSLTHIREQIERAIDTDIDYKYHNQLSEENKKLKDWAKSFNCEYPNLVRELLDELKKWEENQ